MTKTTPQDIFARDCAKAGVLIPAKILEDPRFRRTSTIKVQDRISPWSGLKVFPEFWHQYLTKVAGLSEEVSHMLLFNARNHSLVEFSTEQAKQVLFSKAPLSAAIIACDSIMGLERLDVDGFYRVCDHLNQTYITNICIRFATTVFRDSYTASKWLQDNYSLCKFWRGLHKREVQDNHLPPFTGVMGATPMQRKARSAMKVIRTGEKEFEYAVDAIPDVLTDIEKVIFQAAITSLNWPQRTILFKGTSIYSFKSKDHPRALELAKDPDNKILK